MLPSAPPYASHSGRNDSQHCTSFLIHTSCSGFFGQKLCRAFSWAAPACINTWPSPLPLSRLLHTFFLSISLLIPGHYLASTIAHLPSRFYHRAFSSCFYHRASSLHPLLLLLRHFHRQHLFLLSLTTCFSSSTHDSAWGNSSIAKMMPLTASQVARIASATRALCSRIDRSPEINVS